MTTWSAHDTPEVFRRDEASVNSTPVGPNYVAASQSPSLVGRAVDNPRAFEVKFLLSEASALELERRFAASLLLDPHADPALGHAYWISTLYSDTPAFDVYHRIGSHKRSKFRLRRYGADAQTYLERKTKRGRQVRKKRSVIDAGQIGQLAERESPADWSGHWYHRQWTRRGLRPVCRVSYSRKAYFGACEEGPLRVTFDRDLRAAAVDRLTFDAGPETTLLSDGRVICEFKFRGHLPAPFKHAIEAFQILPGGFSKYRNSVRALGLVALDLTGRTTNA